MATRPTQPLIYDRKQSDVTPNNPKGNYNVSDLNRIMEWEVYIHEYLIENGYYNKITVLPTLQVGDMYKITTKINTLKNNLQNLKNAYAVLSTTPQVPSTSRTKINYVEANDMEKILSDIEKLIGYMQQNYIYGGVANGGQNRIWQQRFRRPRYWGGLQFDNISESTNDITLGNISVLMMKQIFQ